MGFPEQRSRNSFVDTAVRGYTGITNAAKKGLLGIK
jgi:hypothetical protein